MKISINYRGVLKSKQNCDWLHAKHANQAILQICSTVFIRSTSTEDSFFSTNGTDLTKSSLPLSFWWRIFTLLVRF